MTNNLRTQSMITCPFLYPHKSKTLKRMHSKNSQVNKVLIPFWLALLAYTALWDCVLFPLPWLHPHWHFDLYSFTCTVYQNLWHLFEGAFSLSVKCAYDHKAQNLSLVTKLAIAGQATTQSELQMSLISAILLIEIPNRKPIKQRIFSLVVSFQLFNVLLSRISICFCHQQIPRFNGKQCIRKQQVWNQSQSQMLSHVQGL